MSPRLIDGVLPRYPARNELAAADAAAQLRDSIAGFLDEAQLIITAREIAELEMVNENKG